MPDYLRSTKALRDRTTKALLQIGLKTSIYHADIAALSDGNGVPSRAVLAGSSTATFRMNHQAQDQAAVIGIFGTTVAIAIFVSGAESLVRNRAILTDSLQRCWLVRSEPRLVEAVGIIVCSEWLVVLIDANNLPDGVTL